MDVANGTSIQFPPSLLMDPNFVRLTQEKNEIMALCSNNDSIDSRLARNTNEMLCAFMSYLSEKESKFNETQSNLGNLQTCVSENTRTILQLEDRVRAIEFSNKALNGRVAQQENELEFLHDLLNDMMARSMRMNVIVSSVGATYKERANESMDQTIKLFRDFLRDEMRIPDAHSITIERAHRMGKSSENRNKPMIALLQFQTDLNKIFEKVGQLKGTGNFVSVQTPPDYNERKKHSLPVFLDARNQGKRASLLPNGKLIINGRPVKALEPVSIPPCANPDLADIAEEILVGKSDYAVQDTHNFISHSTVVQSTQEIRNALDIFVMEHSKAKHIPYAFRFKNSDGSLCEDFKSCRDTGVGPQILKHLRDLKVENVVCFLAHSYENRYIDGKTKFELIEGCVKDSLRDLNNAVIADQGGEQMSGHEDADESRDSSGH